MKYKKNEGQDLDFFEGTDSEAEYNGDFTEKYQKYLNANEIFLNKSKDSEERNKAEKELGVAGYIEFVQAL